MPSTRFLIFALLALINTIYSTPVLAQGNQGHNSSNHGYHPGSCENLLQRREWRTLSDTEKADYITAVKCLQAHPAINPVFKAAKTRFDEFQAYHIQQADKVHVTGQFLPWHRHFVKRYELALRDECGYKAATPYWDWTQDADEASSISGAPVFDPITGFGGDGVPGTYTLPPNISSDNRVIVPAFRGCVRDGPFANYTLRLGPGKLITEHCLTRGINNDARKYLTSSAMANATKLPTFELFRIELEGEPITSDHRMHDGGHIAVGGEMSNFYSSPGDPLFYLHHANLDRIWWNWQQMLPMRLFEISGRSTIVPPFVNVTLDHPLQMDSALGPTVPIREVVDIHSGPNCYTYV
ncbi:hypothetical protein BDZ97DRAFT_1927844 [Flammula alnicola]|nr:hypothetical protein BDZ97DRAFT_1927844 [Flammula alnicola]